METLGVRAVGKVKEVILPNEECQVFIRNGNLVVIHSGCPVLSLPIPGHVKWVRNADGDVKEVEQPDTDFEMAFYEMTINPILPLSAVKRKCRSLGGGFDGVREALMEVAKVQLLQEEMKVDALLIEDMDWAYRVYRKYCFVLPTDSGDTEGAVIGCIAYHYVGMIAGVK